MNEPATAALARELAALDAAAFATAECRVSLAGIEVMADIGAYDAEKGVPQPLRIDVTVRVPLPRRDELALTFDYACVRGWAEALAAERIVLIETFAWRLARRCLACAHVLEVEVGIGKPRAVPDCLAGTRVTLRRPSAN